MDFITFARANGVLIGSLLMDGRWHRVPTVDKPHKRNGAYKYMGDVGFVQDWGSMTEASVWSPEGTTEGAKVDAELIARRAREAAEEIRKGQEAAAKRAGWILNNCQPAGHPYLAAKGFPEDTGNVWRDEKAGDNKLVIPMRTDGRLVGVQTISDLAGHEKRFLFGQRTDQAVYVIDNKGPTVLCEGYATGLSVRRALQAMRARYKLVITFNAGNLLKVGRNYGAGIVIADYDLPSKQHPETGGHGIAVARELEKLGLTFWHSDREGEDANDYEMRRGTFALTMALKPFLMRKHERA